MVRRLASRGVKAGIVLGLVGATLLATGVAFDSTKVFAERAHSAMVELVGQYRQRAEMVPMLADLVERFAPDGKALMEELAAARAGAAAVPIDAAGRLDPQEFKVFEAAQSRLSAALENVLALARNNADLMLHPPFRALQAELEEVDKRITVARRDHIAAVQAFNREIGSLPGVLRASLSRQQEPLVTFSIGRQEPPATVRN